MLSPGFQSAPHPPCLPPCGSHASSRLRGRAWPGGLGAPVGPWNLHSPRDEGSRWGAGDSPGDTRLGDTRATGRRELSVCGWGEGVEGGATCRRHRRTSTRCRRGAVAGTVLVPLRRGRQNPLGRLEGPLRDSVGPPGGPVPVTRSPVMLTLRVWVLGPQRREKPFTSAK